MTKNNECMIFFIKLWVMTDATALALNLNYTGKTLVDVETNLRKYATPRFGSDFNA